MITGDGSAAAVIAVYNDDDDDKGDSCYDVHADRTWKCNAPIHTSAVSCDFSKHSTGLRSRARDTENGPEMSEAGAEIRIYDVLIGSLARFH